MQNQMVNGTDIKAASRAVPRGLPLPLIFPLLALAISGLAFGLWAGLLRLGWSLPGGDVAAMHGPLMVSGFLGTLITLERAAAIKRWWMFLPPALSGLGWVVGLAMPETGLGPVMVSAGSLGLVAILAVMVRREPQIHTLAMGAGALSWLVGNSLWLAGMPIYRVALWWVAFLVLTIAGERLELSRVLRPTVRQKQLFTAAAGVMVLGAALAAVIPDVGARMAGVGMLALAGWLVRFDIARRNLRHPMPLTRYIAICLFSGYIWLGAGGAIHLVFGAQQAGAIYDAALHTVFVGFVFSMIFGHAPIIFPALLGIPVTFRPVAYLYLGLLHLSLLCRVLGDLLGWSHGRRWGGLLNEVAVTMFLAVTVYGVIQAKVKK